MKFVVSELVHLVYILKPQISDLAIQTAIRQHRDGSFEARFSENENYNTVMDTRETAVLIDILRFHSASSNFSIHLSTYKNLCQLVSY